MSKQKFYVVWSGKKTGIFHTWDECKKQVIGVKDAKYKSFPTEKEAKEAYEKGFIPINKSKEEKRNKKKTTADYIQESISVDAACSGNPGDMEYKGVYTKNGKVLFHFGPIANGTNNIGEFLAIVHALALLQKQNSDLPIYSDSMTAIGWVEKKKANTKIPKNQATKQIWNLIDRAEQWLKTNTYKNKVLKWDTNKWGEIKADFGRK